MRFAWSEQGEGKQMISYIGGVFTGSIITLFIFCMLVAGSDDDDREGRG